ncbi:MAG: hypothetical protein KDD64_04080 [Bdellovibrionales bacterium]|nr:hypothetical protein [Bdellovibrionales bacterium]
MSKSFEEKNKEEALEIIELASGDIETLARAFDLISDACREFSDRPVKLESVLDEVTLH